MEKQHQYLRVFTSTATILLILIQILIPVKMVYETGECTLWVIVLHCTALNALFMLQYFTCFQAENSDYSVSSKEGETTK